MTREEMIEALSHITNFKAQRKELYPIADELGIKYKKTTCTKCTRDLYNIIREELGLIEDAAEESDFNYDPYNGQYEYIYLPKRSVGWMGYIIGQDTPVEIIEKFNAKFPGYYRKVKKAENEETINNQE